MLTPCEKREPLNTSCAGGGTSPPSRHTCAQLSASPIHERTQRQCKRSPTRKPFPLPTSTQILTRPLTAKPGAVRRVVEEGVGWGGNHNSHYNKINHYPYKQPTHPPITPTTPRPTQHPTPKRITTKRSMCTQPIQHSRNAEHPLARPSQSRKTREDVPTQNVSPTEPPSSTTSDRDRRLRTTTHLILIIEHKPLHSKYNNTALPAHNTP
jgi:hypothetical protein